jgi:NAD(P)-dependent dehydrogenase (short-subunit alcohol dehydrogenase family)
VNKEYSRERHQMKLQDLVTLVTGASQGLGKAIAEAFVREGAHVVICARDRKMITTAKEDLEQIASSGQKILALRCDVTSASEVAELFAAIDREIGSIDVLVNNAGVYGPKGPSEEVDLEEWMRAIEINLLGTFLPTRQAITRMKPRKRGKIINLSGGGATNPLPRISAYAAAKAAVVRLTETLAEELREFGIQVNAVAPGALNTRLLDEVLQAGPEVVGAEFYQKALKQRDSGGAPLEKGASACVYLASAQSAGTTGKLLSAIWDPWDRLHEFGETLDKSDIYTLRRIVPTDRGFDWDRPAS